MITLRTFIHSFSQVPNSSMAPSNSASSDVAIGIDLGTTYSCVAVYREGKATVIQSKEGHLTHPSYVAFTETERLVGHGAKNQAAMNPKNTIYNAKRLIGRGFSDEIVQDDAKLWPFTISQGTKDKPTIIVQHKNEEKKFIAEEISAMVLTKMKEIAEEYLDCEIKKAVVTVPAYFNDSQRQCTKDAGKIAGLDVIAILNEPTAAAIAYGADKEAEKRGAKNVLVFDLGGGTIDVSLVKIDGKGCDVYGTDGDTHLGGEDFDDKMVEYCVKEFERKHKIAIGHNPRAVRRLRTACEKTKIELSTRKSTTVEVDGLEGKDFSCKINRAKFESMNKELFEKCMIPVQNCLADAKMDKLKDVHELLLVGGSSRIPKVQDLLREFFGGKDLSKTINPDEAVACGAAIHAFNVNRCCPISDDDSEDKPLVLRDVIPLSLGLEVGKERKMGVLIPKNKSIPTEETKAYSTYYDNQEHVSIKVYQGEKELAKDNHFLGEFKLTEIPPAPKGTTKIDVCFAIDTNGILKVSAEVEAAGNRKEIKIENISMLGEEEINEFKKKNESYKSQDVENNKTMELKNKLEEYVLEVKNKLSAEEEKEWVCELHPDKKLEIDDSIEYFEKWLEDNTEAELAKYENLMKILMRIFDNMMKKKEEEEEDERDTMTPEEAKNWKCVMHPEKRLKPGFTGEPDIKDLFIE